MNTLRSRVAQCGLTVGGLVLATSAGAATLTYPGVAPCNTTLQACINAAASGDVVEIATNTPIVESPTITGTNLTLQPAAGFAPTIQGFVFLAGGAAANVMTVQNLAIQGNLRAAPGTGDLNVSILGNTFTYASWSKAIEISSGTFPPYGNVTFNISNNVVTVTGTGPSDQCGGIEVGVIFDTGTSTGVINRNRVTVTNCGQGAGISVVPGTQEARTVDVIANAVNTPGTTNGIIVRRFGGPGIPLNARVVNNLVTGEVNVAGAVGGLVILADGDGPVTASVINNTVTANENGLMVSARTDLGGSIAGVLANNIVAMNTKGGLQIDSGLVGFSNRNNLVFGNGWDFFTPGPGTAASPPEFVNPGVDFHVMPTSAAVNGGNNADVPGGITTDLDGNPRIVGGIVDIGCYESSAAQRGVEPVPTLGAGALGALCLALAGLGVALLRRKSAA